MEGNGFEYIDLGLSVKWATCNVGANRPENFGLYFAWGETTGYKDFSDKKGGFDWETLKYHTDKKTMYGERFLKYGNRDKRKHLMLMDDAAHVNMGGDWRMPTKEEFQELYNACNTTWKLSYRGVSGMLFTLKSDTSKKLFFPAAGAAYYSSMFSIGEYGRYWSSSLYQYDSYYAYYMYFNSDYVNPHTYNCRFGGGSVRGVLDA